MIGLKRGQESKPIRIPVMEDLRTMQSIEFYQLMNEAVSAVYGVTPVFVSVIGPAGRNPRMQIDVQNRTTQDHQSNFSDLFNDELLSVFGITDWVLVFNSIEVKDELQDARAQHTKAATALTWVRAGFDVKIDELGNLLVTGEGKPTMAAPKDQLGKPHREDEGAPTRTTGEKLELAARLPISWYSATQVRLWNKVFAITQDLNEVYVSVDGVEISGTRTEGVNLNYALASLFDTILGFIGSRLGPTKGFDKKAWDLGRKQLVIATRRQFTPRLLIQLASYCDSVGLSNIAQTFDGLRARLEQLAPGSLQIQPIEQTTEMIAAPGSYEKAIIRSRAPYGIGYQEGKLSDHLTKLMEEAYESWQKGTNKEVAIHEAIVKATILVDNDCDAATKRAIKHAQRRTGKKKIVLGPEELKRLEAFRASTIEDFTQIIRDRFKGGKAKK